MKLLLPPDLAITDKIKSFLKLNVASGYGVNLLDRRSFSDTVTYLFIAFLEIIHSTEQLQKL